MHFTAICFFLTICCIGSTSGRVPAGCLYVAESLSDHALDLPPTSDWKQLVEFAAGKMRPLCDELQEVNPRLLFRKVLLDAELWSLGDNIRSLKDVQYAESAWTIAEIKYRLLDVLIEVTKTLAEIDHLKLEAIPECPAAETLPPPAPTTTPPPSTTSTSTPPSPAPTNSTSAPPTTTTTTSTTTASPTAAPIASSTEAAAAGKTAEIKYCLPSQF